MKTKLIAAIITVFILCNVASAQDYDIRIEHYTNLRASHSLQSAIIETAPAGTILQVIGSVNRWLRINRNGNEVWMASWVGHTRVEGSEQTVSQPANNIDNCCFVDRQCNSDQQWTDGYWAFQNGQCTAPAQTQTQTSTQPASSSPAQVDNCCFVDRQCATNSEWTDGYYAYQNNQCPVSTGSQKGAATSSPAPSTAGNLAWTLRMTEGVKRLLADPSTDPFNNCCFMHHDGTCHSNEDWEHGYWQYQNHQCMHPAPLGTRPAIVGNDSPLGTAKFTNLVNTALELMRIHAPEWLNYIDISGARQFELLPADVGGGFFNQQWTIAHGYYSWQQNDPNWEPDFDYIVGYAGGITHEACHAIKQRTYTQTAGWTNEADCVEAQLAVIEAINPNSRDVPWLRNLVASYQ